MTNLFGGNNYFYDNLGISYFLRKESLSKDVVSQKKVFETV